MIKSTKSLFYAAITCFAILMVHSARSQIYLKPDPGARFDRSKGILVLSSSVRGTFFLDDHVLSELKGRDTVYIANLACGEHRAKVVSGKNPLTYTFIMAKGKVLEIHAGKDTLGILESPVAYEDIAEKIRGGTVFFLRSRSYFNITQTSFLTLEVNNRQYDGAKWFRTIATINGFQTTFPFKPLIIRNIMAARSSH